MMVEGGIERTPPGVGRREERTPNRALTLSKPTSLPLLTRAAALHRRHLGLCIRWMSTVADVCSGFRRVLCTVLTENRTKGEEDRETWWLEDLDDERGEEEDDDNDKDLREELREAREEGGEGEESSESEREREEREEGQKSRTLSTVEAVLQYGPVLPPPLQDAVGVLTLSLLLDPSFKAQYTTCFVRHYASLIRIFLLPPQEWIVRRTARLIGRDETSPATIILTVPDALALSGAVSRFLDRIFCQLFHNGGECAK